jgi:hypothetical protein
LGDCPLTNKSENDTSSSDSLRDLSPLVVKERPAQILEISRLTPQAKALIIDEIGKRVEAQRSALLAQLKNQYVTQGELVASIICIAISVASGLMSLYFSSLENVTIALLLVWPAGAGIVGAAILLYATTRSDLLD